MARPTGATPGVRRGSRATVTTAGGEKINLETRDEVQPMPAPIKGPLATVGCSLTVGQSTEYAREKIEVSAWCTLPCEPHEEAIREAYETSYQFVVTELKTRSDDAMAQFFNVHGGGE